MRELEKEIKEKFLEAEIFEHSPRRFYVTIRKEKIREMAQFLFREKGFRLSIITGVDSREGMEILYHFSEDKTGTYWTVKVFVDKAKPKVDTISDITKAASWIEREIWELLGVEFVGHPNLVPLLTAEDWPRDKFPLRRDYE